MFPHSLISLAWLCNKKNSRKTIIILSSSKVVYRCEHQQRVEKIKIQKNQCLDGYVIIAIITLNKSNNNIMRREKKNPDKIKTKISQLLYEQQVHLCWL
jgi:hypothetical protein